MSTSVVIFLQSIFGAKKIERQHVMGDASAREYQRVCVGDKSFVLCLDTDRDNFNRFVTAAEWFVTQGIAVPLLIKIDKQQLLILQEDIGDCSLERFRQKNNQSLKKQINKGAIDLMLQLHKTTKDEHVFLFQWQFDEQKLSDELLMMKDFFWKKFLKCEWNTKLDIFFSDINKLFLEIPYALVHRDFHSRNLHYYNELVYMIDFQDARLGPITYDLVSYLEDPYSPLSREEKIELKEYFISHLLDRHDRADMEYWYNIVAIQRLFKILGSFTYLNYEKHKERYLQYIPATLERIVEILEILPSNIHHTKDILQPLKEILNEY